MIIKDLRDAPVIMDGKPLTIADSCMVSLLQTYQDEQNQSLASKVMRYRLAVKFAGANGTLPPLSSEEVSEVKVCVAKYWSPLVLGRVIEAIDPESLEG